MPEVSEKLVGEMNEIEFNALIEKFIGRETEGTGEVPAEVLFEALPDFLIRAYKAGCHSGVAELVPRKETK